VKIIRVFITRTNATPYDENVRINELPGMFDTADTVHISVLFTWDLERAFELQKHWNHVAPTTVGGPGLGMKGYDFTPGMYVKNGYTITSRGCPNKCWFCSVPKRDGPIRELPIMPGWNVLDDNILACSEGHIKSVFSMLSSQQRPAEFTGGFEAKLLRSWHVEELRKLRIKRIFFAYDTPDDYEPLREAAKMMWDGGFSPNRQIIRAYCLTGFPKDTFENAEKRLLDVVRLGMIPMSMLWRNNDGERKQDWIKWNWPWVRAASIKSMCKSKGVMLGEAFPAPAPAAGVEGKE
jgi:hypothetical protein